MKYKIIIGSLVVTFIVVIFVILVRRENTYDDFIAYDSSMDYVDDFDYIPEGDFIELVGFDTFNDEQIDMITRQCDDYVINNNLYTEGEVVSCSFYDINNDESIVINIIGTDIYFNVYI